MNNYNTEYWTAMSVEVDGVTHVMMVRNPATVLDHKEHYFYAYTPCVLRQAFRRDDAKPLTEVTCMSCAVRSWR